MAPFDDVAVPGPVRSKRNGGRVLWIVLAVGILVLGPLVAIATVVLFVGSQVFPEPDTNPDPEVVLAFAGFPSTAGLEVSDLRHSAWLDESVDFTLRGSPDEVERALDAAGFTGTFEPGLEPQLSGSVDPATVHDLHSANDVWINAEARRIYRHLARGTAADDPSITVVRVMAFTA